MREDLPTVWMLSPWFPPRRRVGALRAWRFATHLPDHGWNPVVTCLATTSSELAAEETIEAGRFITRSLPTGLDFTVGGRSSSDLSSSQSGSARARRAADVGAPLRAAIDRVFPVDTWLPLLAMHAPAMLRDIRSSGASVLWSTGNPWSGHVTCAALAARTGVPWVADYRDPWTLDPQWRSARHSRTLAIDDAIERRVLAQAASIVFTSWSTAAEYRAHFGIPSSRVHVIPNAYGADLNRVDFERSVRRTLRRPSAERPWRLLFFGRFRPTSPARTWVEALARLESLRAGATRMISLQSVGGLDAPSQALADRLGVSSCFESTPSVPYHAARERLQQADALILSLGTERTDVIPAKLWDYVASGVPIIAPVDNPDAIRVISDTGTGYAPPMDPDGLASWLLALLNRAEQARAPRWPAPFNPVFTHIEQYSAASTTAKLSQCLRQAVTQSAPARR